MRWWLPLLFWPLLAASAQTRSTVVSTTARGDSLFAQILFDSVHLRPVTPETVTVIRVDTLWRSLPSSKPGVLFGAWAAPTDSLGKPYNIALIGTQNLIADLAKAQAKKAKVVIYLNRNASRVNGVLSVAAVKRHLDTLPHIQPYIADGTVWGIMLMDDLNGTAIWGPGAPYLPEIDSLGLLVRQRWGPVRTIVRATASQMKGRTWQWVDYVWAQYGAMKRNGTVTAYRDREIATADSLQLCLVFGLNSVDGGNGTSGITHGDGLWEMTPAEYELYAKALLPHTPILLHWQYRKETEARLRPAYTKVRAIADTTTPKACR